MPELPEVEAARRRLDPFFTGYRIDDVVLRRPDLRAPFPRRFRARLVGRSVVTFTRRAKYLLATMSSGETLLMHLGMSGSLRVNCRPTGDDRSVNARHDHVVFAMSSGAAIIFNDPRRFGLMDLLTRRQLDAHPALSTLGFEPLSQDFDAAALAGACYRRNAPLKVALLDQKTVAGLGNIYASEALHAACLSPLRKASSIATAAGEPQPAACQLVTAIKQVLEKAVERQTARTYQAARFRVYDREGAKCLRPGCGGTVRRRVQAGRSTYYCPRCQR